MAENIESIFVEVEKLVRQAGALIRNIGEMEVEEKLSRYDLVTKYDKQVEQMLIENLKKLYPHHKFIGEETSAETKQEPELTEAPTWIIDPIDGTMNFTHHCPLFAISVGFTVKKKLEIGIVYMPVYDQFYSAIAGQGAYLNGKKISPSNVTELKSGLINVEGDFNKFNEKFAARYTKINKICHGIRSLGSTAVALAYVASGYIDGYITSYVSSWDIAGGVLILQEAGGSCLNLNSETFDLMTHSVVAAGTKQLCDELNKLNKDGGY